MKGQSFFKFNPRARGNQQTQGFVKILLSKETGIVEGVHIIGAQAGEQVMQGVMALMNKNTGCQLSRLSHPHPSFAESFKGAAQNACAERKKYL